MSETDGRWPVFYENWENYQKLIVQAVVPLSSNQLKLRVAPHLRTLSDLVAHIITTRVNWFHDVAGAGGKDVEVYMDWDFDNAPQRGPDELRTGLEASWQLVINALNTWTTAEFIEPFQVQGRDQVFSITRQWITWHVLEHDLHHGGELSFSLGIHGLPGVNID